MKDTFGSSLMMSDGLNFRWLFVMPDHPTEVKRDYEDISSNIASGWDSTINDFISAGNLPKEMLLANDADELYKDFVFENNIAASTESDNYIRGIYKKMNVHVLRWAGIVHIITNRTNAYITTAEMEYSIRCMQYFFRCHAERIMPLLIGEDKDVKTKSMTDEDAIKHLSKKIKNISKFAESMDVSRQYISGIIHSEKGVVGCGCGIDESQLIKGEKPQLGRNLISLKEE